MNRYVVLVLAIYLAGVCSASDRFLEDVKQIAETSDSVRPPFTEDKTNYDLHADIFYYQDQQVAQAYKRSIYQAGKITLAGQGPDLTGRKVQAAVNPFAVGQRSLHGLGVSSDRWDVKDNGKDGQLFALYHGNGGSDFVVNKLRAHLLRLLANNVQDYFPILARTSESDAQKHEPQVNSIHDDLRATIENVFREVDETIRSHMKDKDDSSASATVAIVTPSHVITANVGEGRVLAYDDQFNVQDLTPARDSSKVSNVFGAKKSRPDGQPLYAHVEIYPRVSKGQAGGDEASDADDSDDDDERNMQMLLLESASVSSILGNYEAFKMVLSSVNQHKEEPRHEQDLYSRALDMLLDTVAARLNVFQKLKKPDHSVALVGLETDYENIH